MFEIKAKDNHIEISTIGFNTYATTPIDVMLYIKDGQYRDATYDMDEWMHVLNITVVGQGIGNPTYIPEGSFEPILIERGKRMSFYLVTTSGPILVCSKGNVERRAVDIYNPDLILYEGLGKRLPIDVGSIFTPRIFNGVIGYYEVGDNIVELFGTDSQTDAPSITPTTSPTIVPEWEDAIEPSDPPNDAYFNYNPNSKFGPGNWDTVKSDGYYDKLQRMDSTSWDNRCTSGLYQSPRDLCQEDSICLETHEIRRTVC